MRVAALLPIYVYRWVFSPMKAALLGPYARCRYYPSCSQYAKEAICEHGVVKGGWLSATRIAAVIPGMRVVMTRFLRASACGKAPKKLITQSARSSKR